jgi:hypothetical protein
MNAKNHMILFISLILSLGCIFFSYVSYGKIMYELTNGLAIVFILLAIRQLHLLGFRPLL